MGTQIALAIDSGKIPGILTHVYDDSKEASTSLVSKLNNKPEIVENSHYGKQEQLSHCKRRGICITAKEKLK